jgi:hypothetical protein
VCGTDKLIVCRGHRVDFVFDNFLSELWLSVERLVIAVTIVSCWTDFCLPNGKGIQAAHCAICDYNAKDIYGGDKYFGIQARDKWHASSWDWDCVCLCNLRILCLNILEQQRLKFKA